MVSISTLTLMSTKSSCQPIVGKQEIEQVDWVPGPVAQAPLGPLRKEKIMLGLLFSGEFTIEIVVLIIKTMGYN